MSIFYEYPTKRTIEKLNQVENIVTEYDYNDFQSIKEIIGEMVEECGERVLEDIADILRIPKEDAVSLETTQKYVEETLIPSEARGRLSPGAMSNAPDRLDGFHTYNICCRGQQDTGRHTENLRTYGIDRRAFEYWVDGNWSAANDLMNRTVHGECESPDCSRVEELTADHIGPLSLGFAHRPRFLALCRSCNSSKNNRMSHSDVQKLISDEDTGEVVISWYSQAIWNRLKGTVENDFHALRLSKLLRANQHHYLMLLSKIAELCHYDFLTSYLHLDYAHKKYEFVGLSETNFNYDDVKEQERQKTYADSMIERGKRIAFESIHDYSKKINRNAILFKDPDLLSLEKEIYNALKTADYEKSHELLRNYMLLVSEKLIEKGVPRGYWK